MGFSVPEDYGRRRGLAPRAEARELVTIALTPENRPIELEPVAAASWKEMAAAAGAAGVTLVPVSGFRSIGRQVEIIERKLAEGLSLAQILETNAAPGFSEHHTGRAVDIAAKGQAPLTDDFEKTEAYAWLSTHAGRYGFSLSYPRGNPHGIAYEPWHWFHGRR